MSDEAGRDPSLVEPIVPADREDSETSDLIRSEEELAPRTVTQEAGSVRIRKEVDTYPVEQIVERNREQIDDVGQRVPASEGDSGQIETLPDGSVSIPVLEEEIVVTKRVVVRERLILRRVTITDEHKIETELRKERVEIDADPGINVVDNASESSEESLPQEL